MSNQARQPAAPNQASPIPCLPIASAKSLLANENQRPFQRFLLPFRDHFLVEPDFDHLLDLTRQTRAELILLHLSEAEACLDEEGLFTTFRALQNHANQIVMGVTIDELKEATTVTLMAYAHSHNIDLIVYPSSQLEV